MKAKLGTTEISECNFCMFLNPLDNSFSRIPLIGKHFLKYTQWVCSEKRVSDNWYRHTIVPNIDTVPKWCPHLIKEGFNDPKTKS